MASSAYTTRLRALLCPTCGAPITTPPQGGTYECGYCRTIGSVSARMDARTHMRPRSPAEEHARLAKLRFQLEQGHLASPYSTYVAPPDLKYLLELCPPHSWGPWFEAWKQAVAQLTKQPNEQNQKRIAWLAALTSTAALDLTHTDPTRARAIRETALDLLPDPGHKHLMRCKLASAACTQGDVASAEQWLAACDPYPNNITLDSAYRISSSFLHIARGRWGSVLEALGDAPDVVPIDHGSDMLAGLLRVHACEELGYAQAAEGQLLYWFEQEKKLDGPVLLTIIEANTPVHLCRRTCARLGIQVPY
jgi:hypothetical protein